MIDYILKTQDNKLNRKLAEAIAGQWQRNKVETVDDAMKLAEKHYKQYKKKSATSTTVKQRIMKEEKIPEWLNKEIDKQEASKEEQDEMNNLLSKYQ